jgi:hypothetical protein
LSGLSAYCWLSAVNTIANYDLGIIPYLDKPVVTAWGRNDEGEFAQEEFSPEGIDGH